MAQIRVVTNRGRAGDAARAAEEQRRSEGVHRMERIQAGSAARLAEQARRATFDEPAGAMRAPSFGLRASNGRVERRDVPPAAAPHTAAHDERGPAGERREAVAAADPGQTATSPRQATPPPPESGAGRLKTFLRGLFLPDKPPSPSEP